MVNSLFSSTAPESYLLKEITYERWIKGFIKDANIKSNTTKQVILRRADAAVQRFLDKGRGVAERNVVYDYMTEAIGEVDLINSLKMTKLQKTYLWPILPSITGYIAGNVSDKELSSICHKFYVEVLTGNN